jgi:hypothetical protein
LANKVTKWLKQPKVKREIIKLTILYLVISPWTLSHFYRYFIFFPDKKHYPVQDAIKQIETRFKVGFREVQFPSANGKVLNAWHFKQAKPACTVLFLHGNAGNIAHRLPITIYLANLGCSVLLLDYQGYGKSQGSPDFGNATDDAVAAFDYLVNTEKCPASQIVVFGESVGSGVACQLLKQRQPGGVVLLSSFFSLFKTIKDRLPWYWLYPPFMTEESLFNSAAVLRGKHPTLLILHGDKDEAMPVENSRELARVASEPKTLVELPHSGHNEVAVPDLPEFTTAFNRFLHTAMAH